MPDEHQEQWAAYDEVFQRALAIDPQLAHDFDRVAMNLKIAEVDEALCGALRGQDLVGELTLGDDGPALTVRLRIAEEVSA